MSPERRKAVSEGVHLALVEDFGVPNNGKFHTITAYDSDNVHMDEGFLGVSRGKDFSFIEILVMEGHSDEEKRALLKNIRTRLLGEASLKPEDLFISIVEAPKANWFCCVK